MGKHGDMSLYQHYRWFHATIQELLINQHTTIGLETLEHQKLKVIAIVFLACLHPNNAS